MTAGAGMVHGPNTGTRMKGLLLLLLLTAAMLAPAVVCLGTEVWEGNPSGSQSILACDIFAGYEPNTTLCVTIVKTLQVVYGRKRHCRN